MKKISLFTFIFSLSLILVFSSVDPLSAEAPKCSDLNSRQCVTTKGCFLDCEGKSRTHCSPYRCRDAKGVCELTFSQWDVTKGNCEKLQNCHYDAANCFCPGPEECYCGGGAPSMCREL